MVLLNKISPKNDESPVCSLREQKGKPLAPAIGEGGVTRTAKNCFLAAFKHSTFLGTEKFSVCHGKKEKKSDI